MIFSNLRLSLGILYGAADHPIVFMADVVGPYLLHFGPRWRKSGSGGGNWPLTLRPFFQRPFLGGTWAYEAV